MLALQKGINKQRNFEKLIIITYQQNPLLNTHTQLTLRNYQNQPKSGIYRIIIFPHLLKKQEVFPKILYNLAIERFIVAQIYNTKSLEL